MIPYSIRNHSEDARQGQDKTRQRHSPEKNAHNRAPRRKEEEERSRPIYISYRSHPTSEPPTTGEHLQESTPRKRIRRGRVFEFQDLTRVRYYPLLPNPIPPPRPPLTHEVMESWTYQTRAYVPCYVVAFLQA